MSWFSRLSPSSLMPWSPLSFAFPCLHPYGLPTVPFGIGLNWIELNCEAPRRVRRSYFIPTVHIPPLLSHYIPLQYFFISALSFLICKVWHAFFHTLMLPSIPFLAQLVNTRQYVSGLDSNYQFRLKQSEHYQLLKSITIDRFPNIRTTFHNLATTGSDVDARIVGLISTWIQTPNTTDLARV